MAIELPKIGAIEAFAMIVDINGYTLMVDRSNGDIVAQYIRDVLTGGIVAVENYGGEVVGFMGDAFFAVLPDALSVFHSCVAIAKDVDEQCEYLSMMQREYANVYPYSPGGPGLKIAVEYGWLDISTISSNLLGEQRLLIGPPVNYAARISAAGVGNRCLFGPEAAASDLGQYALRGPFRIKGKKGEGVYKYYQLYLGDIWREGQLGPSHYTYWG